MRLKRGLAVLACAALGLTTACVHIFWRTEAVPIDPTAPGPGRRIETPLKVHLADGSTVIFRSGAHINARGLTGVGQSYALLSDAATARDVVPMDSVVALETFEGQTRTSPTIVASAAATALGAVGTLALLKAIFGSCPTLYADTGSGPVLEAEGFSYAIAPLFEHRDIDRLRARPDRDGVVRLELRNEALETHFINHMELLAVRHRAGSRVMPDQSGRLIEVGDLTSLSAARDRSGRDVRAVLHAADGELYATPDTIADGADVNDLYDWIDVEAAGIPTADSIVVVLRLRNSLLNTILLYDEMLRAPNAIDWLASGLQQISTAVDLSRWYTRTMGMHAVLPGPSGEYSGQPTAARLNDVGPLAFRDVAIVLPSRPSADGVTRVRLRFVADNWRIDHAAIAGAATRPNTSIVALSRVVVPTPARGGSAVIDSAAASALAEIDDRYLETLPGQRMTLEFAAGPAQEARSGEETTFLVAWQGWYREWIRREWVTEPSRATPFVAGDAALMSAMKRWRERKSEFERAFYASRVPVQ